MPRLDLVEGDYVIVRSGEGEPDKIAVFLSYMGGGTVHPTLGPRYAKVCWFDVDPVQMKACARRVYVKNITGTGERHPAWVIRDNLKGVTITPENAPAFVRRFDPPDPPAPFPQRRRNLKR